MVAENMAIPVSRKLGRCSNMEPVWRFEESRRLPQSPIIGLETDRQESLPYMTKRQSEETAPIIEIDKESGIPIWLQLRNRLIYLITAGYFKVGDKIPTVRELSVSLGVNYNTVSKVYRDIERDGYIISQRGRGTFVDDKYKDSNSSADQPIEALVDEFIRRCLEMGIVTNDIPRLIDERLKKIG